MNSLTRLCVIAFFYSFGLELFAQSGSLDHDFNARVEAPSGDRTFVSTLVVQPDGKILVGGRFETVEGVYRYRIARLYQDGSRDVSFPYVDPNNIVRGITLQQDGKILLVGDFTTIGGFNREGVARLMANGALDTAFFATIDNATTSVAEQNGQILVGGYFGTVNGALRYALARLNSDGSLDDSFRPPTSPGNWCNAIVPRGNQVFVAGPIGGSSINLLNSDGSRDTNFSRSAVTQGAISLALHPGGKVLVGANRQALRLNADGTLDSSFQSEPGPNREVLAIALQPDGKVLMAGSFTTYHGAPAHRIVRLNTNGTVDLTFSASANTNINAVAVQPDGKVLIAGEFQDVNGTPRTLVARLLGDFPVLRSIRSGANELTFSWPTAYTNYVLESATAVPSVNWQPVANSPVMNSNNWSVTNSIGPSNQFFRLRNQ